jgi:hypothetical protein
MDLKVIGGTVAAIAVATAILCLIGGRTRRGWGAGSWAILLALAAAPLAADRPLPTNEWPNIHTTGDEQRVLLAGVPLAILAAAASGKRVPAFVRGTLALLAPPAILYWVLKGYPIPPLDNWPTRLAVPGAISLVLWLLIEPLAVRKPTGIAGPWICGCLAAGVGLLNLFSADTSPGWVAVALGGAIGGTFLFALTGRGPSFAGGPVAVIVPLLVCLVMANRINDATDVPTWQWLLLTAAPAAAWLVELRPMKHWTPWLREPLRMALVAVPVVIAVVPAAKRSAKEQSGDGGDAAGWSMVMPASPTVEHTVAIPV